METAAIVTTVANATMATVHHRAPVIVPPEQFDFWLDCRNVEEKMAAELLVPAPRPDGDLRDFAGGQSGGERLAGTSAALQRGGGANAVGEA
jgi:putative SOS response-associated peptidase YedK